MLSFMYDVRGSDGYKGSKRYGFSGVQFGCGWMGLRGKLVNFQILVSFLGWLQVGRQAGGQAGRHRMDYP